MAKERRGNATAAREEFVYGSVLEALTQGLYPEKRHVLREFVQNAFDALQELRRSHKDVPLHPITVRLEPPSITVFDQGIGMSEKQMREYRYLGFSQKDPALNVGFRGIGKFSGVAVAKKIVVTSTRLGNSKEHQVTIDAEGIFNHLKNETNAVLNDLLARHSTVSEKPAKPTDHYTMVELREIRDDSKSLFDETKIAEYLRRVVPVRFDPTFVHGTEISKQLQANVSDFFECDLRIGSRTLYKPFPATITAPQFVPVFESTDPKSALLAYCWFVKNTDNRQFQEDEFAGLVYRMKNFVIGDGWYVRNELWTTSPQLAFWHYGEIHVCDSGVIPSADRTTFEDNANRQRLQAALAILPQRLNREALAASAIDRLDRKVRDAKDIIDRRNAETQAGTLDANVRPDVRFEIMRVIEDINKRLKRAGTSASAAKTRKKGISVLNSAKRLLTAIDTGDKLYDVTKTVQMSDEAKLVFNIAVQAIREEFAGNSAIVEKLIRRISARIEERFRRT